MTTDRALLARSAAVASISVALILVALKTWASWRTGSTAMLGSLADSALDLVASLATLTGVWIASMPADEDHRFGHGKAEALAAIFQVMLIALSAFGIAVRAIMQLAAGGPTAAAQEGIAVSLIAIALTFALLSWQRFVMNRTRSLAIQTDHLHYKSDLLLNLAVIAALVLDQYAGFGIADPLFGLAIADFVQFHVDLPPALTIAAAHAIIDRVEADLLAQFPGTELLIHIDPEGHVDEPDNPLVEDNEFAKLEKDA